MTEAQKADLIDEFMEELPEIVDEFEDDSLPEEDLMQEACVGLLEGVNAIAESDQDEWGMNLDETIRTAIRNAIQRAIDENKTQIRDDDRVVAQVELLNSSIDRLTEELGSKPNVDEIANDMKISQETVLSILKLTGETPDEEAFFDPRRR